MFVAGVVTSGSGSGVVSTLVRSLSNKLSAVAKRGLGSLATSDLGGGLGVEVGGAVGVAGCV